MSATTPTDRIDATTSLPHARAHRAATVVREVFWRSLSPLAKFTALGLPSSRRAAANDALDALSPGGPRNTASSLAPSSGPRTRFWRCLDAALDTR